MVNTLGSAQSSARTVLMRFLRSRLVLVALAVIASWQALPATIVTYDIVYVRAPRPADTNSKWTDVFRPMGVEAGSDLVVLHPDGQEDVLVRAGNGAVTDPCVSFDAQ